MAHFFEKLYAMPAQAGCIMIFCAQSIPEKIINFHRLALLAAGSNTLPYSVILLDDIDLEGLFAQLSITFLGQVCLYALKDGPSCSLSPTERKKLNLFLKEYTGPHYVYFFTNDPLYEKNALVLDTVITQRSFQELVMSTGLNVAPSFIEKLYTYRSSYTFDEALSLVRYADLLGARNDLFFSAWLTRILADDTSLFILSQYFFSQQKNLLIQEWIRLKDHYTPEFWIAFFSEQLWQAALYVQYTQAGKSAEAKRHAYRLPFSFFQKDYKRYTLTQLAKAHEFLYKIDHGLKNGYATDGLELFIHTAFSF